jgi:ABC-type branched-subunit amino acid transport system permease subunit
MEVIWFTLIGAVLYLVADRILDQLERRAGRRFENRSLIFFGLLLGLAVVSFSVIRRYTG